MKKSNQTNKKTVAVIFGGKSVEHDISIITGVQTLNALDKTKYIVVPIYISKSGIWYTSSEFFNIKTFSKSGFETQKNIQIINLLTDGFLYYAKKNKAVKGDKLNFAFLATHGGNGENGALQGFLEVCGVAFSSTDVFSSAVCMNKLATKILLDSSGIPVTNYKVIYEDDYAQGGFNEIKKSLEDLKFPIIVKPCNLGSSIGITFCTNKQNLKDAISFAFLFDNCVLVEEVVENLKEVNLSLLKVGSEIKTSEIEEVNIKKDFLTFENKYLNSENSAKGMENTSRTIPAQLETEVKNKVLEYGKIAYKTLMCKGVVRIDFLINSKTNDVFLNEVNTIPGSLANYLWAGEGLNFTELLNKILEENINSSNAQSKKITNFSSTVLTNFEKVGKLGTKK